MTAVVVIVRPGAAYLATDGISVSPNGFVEGFIGKALAFPHLPAAIAIRGPAWMLGAVHENAIDGFATFDELVTGLIPPLQAAHLYGAKQNADRPGRPDMDDANSFELFLIGQSAARKSYEGYVVSDIDQVYGPAWKVHPIRELAMVPFDEASANRLRMTDAAVRAEMRASPPDTLAIKLMEAQRQILGSMDRAAPPFSSVGGFVEFTMLQNSKVLQTIIHRWPDKVGEKIAIA